MLSALLYLAFGLGLTCVIVALRYGDWPERAAGWIVAMMLVVPRVYHWIDPKIFSSADPVTLVTDVAALIGFISIALKAKRYWPLWVSALQLLSTTAHLVRWYDIEIEPLVYAAMSGGPSYLISFTIIAASLARRRSRARVNVSTF